MRAKNLTGSLVNVALILIVALGWLAAAQVNLRVNWLVKEDVSEGLDTGFAVCISGDYIYVVGYDALQGDLEFRIEMREKASGRLVKDWTYNPSKGRDLLHDCFVAGDRLYVVGGDEKPGDSEWVILVFDLSLNLITNVTHNPSEGSDWAKAVFSDGEYLYVAGDQAEEWRVEKRRLNDLSLVKVYTSDPSGDLDFIHSIAVNPVTGELWVVGTAFVPAEDKFTWHIEILDKDLTRIKVIEPGIEEVASSVAFDEEGYAYVVGRKGIAKFDKDGEMIKVNREYNGSKTFYVDGYLYVASAVSRVLKPGEVVPPRHALLVFDKNLNLVKEIPLGEERGYFPVGKMGFDGENLFIAGNYRISEENIGWIIFSVAIAKSREIKCPGRIEAIKAIPGNIVRFGESLKIEVSLSDSGLLLSVVAYSKELGEEYVLFNSTVDSKTVNITWDNLSAGKYTVLAYLRGNPKCRSEPLEIEVLKSRPELSIKVEKEKVEIGEEVIVEGHIDGFAESVYVNFTSPTGEIYTQTAKVEDSAFTVRLKPEEAGTWTVVAFTLETPNNYASTSNTLTIEIIEKPTNTLLLIIIALIIIIVATLLILSIIIKKRKK